MQQTVLPFKLEETTAELTAHAGLAGFGEYLAALRFTGLVDELLPESGSAQGYRPSEHVQPLVLMLAGGGRSLEDMRMLRADTGLQRLLKIEGIPSSDAAGDWLRRQGSLPARSQSSASAEVGGEVKGMAGLLAVHKHLVARFLHREERTDYTLDIDATQIIAEKYEAQYTYKGEKGYMPLVGHLAENGIALFDKFRDGNASPAAGNLEFMQACDAMLPKGKRIGAIRADSAAYQADIFNWCEETGKVFAIGADQDVAVKAVIRDIPESAWVKYGDAEIAEALHCMSKTNKAFRLIVLRRPQEQDLLDKTIAPYRYHAIASNRENEDAAATMRWYAKRGDASENRIKDLKIGLGMERMPCGTLEANAVFFRVGVIAYNLYLGFRGICGQVHAKSQIQTLRWQIFNTAGKVVRHAGQVFLQVSAHLRQVFAELRQRCWELSTEPIHA